MKKIVRLTESDINNMVKKVLKEWNADDEDYNEDIELFDVITPNYNLESNRDELLNTIVYDKDDNCLGPLGYLHIKYFPNDGPHFT